MRTIIQLSDLHFGSVLEPTLEPLIEVMWSLKPDLVIVSGDLTQRAKREQFQAAQRYVARMPTPRIVVPGNHDIPLYNVFRRFVHPLAAYTTHISGDLAPSYVDEEVAVVAINSARSFTFKGGTLGKRQVAVAVSALRRAAPDAARRPAVSSRLQRRVCCRGDAARASLASLEGRLNRHRRTASCALGSPGVHWMLIVELTLRTAEAV